ncbi:hypothetical protein DV096_04220 [Bradymonadaceae bacterium TMQ3]|nr:hypothetical protein DV096_04220 [Bradymonadaceae bacterium TMQ3]TXC77478.1 hypothetical protein FRC91_01715 [Bradymonadales bacterium TMQ1]
MLNFVMETFDLNSIQVFLILFFMLVVSVIALYWWIVGDLARTAWTNASEAMGLQLSGDSLESYRLQGTYQGAELEIASRHEREVIRRTEISEVIEAYFIEVHVTMGPTWTHFGHVAKKKPATLHDDNAPGIINALSPDRFDDELHVHVEPNAGMRRIFADGEVREALLTSSLKAGNLKISNGTLCLEYKKRVINADEIQAYADQALTLAKLLESRVAGHPTPRGAAPAAASAPVDARVTYW